MAAVDPYSQCPCGSGEKFKWCCQKVEAQADRAERLAQSGQLEAAIEVVEEGLRKEKDNPWLLTRLAIYQLRQREPGLAKLSLQRVLARQPKHFGAVVLLCRLILETEGAVAGAAQLQHLLTSFSGEPTEVLGKVVRLVGVALSEAGFYAAGLKHLLLARALSPEGAPGFEQIKLIQRSPSVPAWVKNPYRLSPPPSTLSGPGRETFEKALNWAESGLWSSAASAFEVLSADPAAGIEADRNLGLCRLWLADETGAVAALRRYIARAGVTTDAVDLESLCQLIAPPGADDLIEHVHLSWPVRDADALHKLLHADLMVHELGHGPIDPDDPESPHVEHFGLLDRPPIKARADLRIDELPRFVARVLLGKETVSLESYDDGRLDDQVDRFTALAGHAISPAHPRTKVLGKVTRASLALSWDWLLPEGTDPEVAKRLNQEEGARLVREKWPNTPMPYLGGRTPLQAAQAGGYEVPLRAAVLQLEETHEDWQGELDFQALRATLKIGPEPTIDAETADLSQLHLSRLDQISVDSLSDAKLSGVYRRAQSMGLFGVLARAARALVDRPDAWERVGISPMMIHADLAGIAAAEGRAAEAYDWVRRGRESEPAAKRAANATAWDMLELKMKARLETPDKWVPDMAVLLERCEHDPAANQTVVMGLIQMGIVQMTPHPEKPEEYLLDTRTLQALMEEYGPRVTTASGQLGVAATKGQLWTPGGTSAPAGGSGLWTPGSGTSAPAPGGDKPRLIIPGR